MSKNKSAKKSQKKLNKVTKPQPLSQFDLTESKLRLALVTTQYALRETRTHQNKKGDAVEPTGLLVLVNGIELAGKGRAVTQLRQWVDPRLLQVEATVGQLDDGYEPIWQKHSKKLPRHGEVMVYFGNWYADLIQTALRMARHILDEVNDNSVSQNPKQKPSQKLSKKLEQKIKKQWQQYVKHQINKLSAYEKDLKNNHTQILKCWFHIDIDTLQQRLADCKNDPTQLYQLDWTDRDMVEQFNRVAQTILGEQDDWIIIDGTDDNEATLLFIHHVLHAMQVALRNSRDSKKETTLPSFVPVDVPDKLINVADANIGKAKYKRQLADKQQQLAKLLRRRGSRHIVFAFEGMDAAGKGGAIKRLVAPLDPREYQIYNIGAPMQHELEHPYLWRFWTKLPSSQGNWDTHGKGMQDNRIAIFDRTWYGRVLVERIEGFASKAEWQRAYDEINRFERDLADAGTIVLKFWLAIDKEEQLARFESRKKTPYKQFKLTDEDWRNRDKWDDYVQSASDMLARTNSQVAPWCMIATNDKRTARLMVLDHAIEQLQQALG